MPRQDAIRIVGLTGGIASGKSTVARLLAARGIPVIDADQLSRAAVEPGQPALAEIAQRWPEVIRPDGTLDRARLGEIVFRDDAERAALTALLLPRIRALFEGKVRELEAYGAPVCVFEAPTLLEENLDHLVDGVLLLSLPPEEQVRRLVARDGLSEEAARQRLAAQLPLEAKLPRARWVVENTGDERELEARVRAVWEQVMRDLLLG